MATPALKAKELGNKAYKAKQFDTAIKHYDEAIALDPTDITFYNNKGGLCTDFIVPSCYFGSDLHLTVADYYAFSFNDKICLV